MTTEYTTSDCEIRAVPRSTSVLWLQSITVIWMLAECGVSLFAAARAHSPAMLAFGADSLVELFSAAILLLQFLPSLAISERQVGKIAAILLFALAILVAVIAGLSLAFDVQSESSAPGIGVTVIALIIMPVLGWLKTAGSAATEQSRFGSRRHPVGNLCLSCWRHTARPWIKRHLSYRMV